MSPADLLLFNARVLTQNPARPLATAVAVAGERIIALGSFDELQGLAGPQTAMVDAQGGTAAPGFHDAHLHLLSYARQKGRVDCRGIVSLDDLVERFAARVANTPPGGWIRAAGLDQLSLTETVLPDRTVLDRAAPRHLVRLQDRSLHLDVLNTSALRATDLWDERNPSIERDAFTGEPTGRIFHGSELLRGRFGRPLFSEIARDVQSACAEMAAYGLTTIQDASVTNGVEEWDLFHQLADGGYLGGLRLFMMPGARLWREVPGAPLPTSSVRFGPVKFMLDENRTDPRELRDSVAEVRAAGKAVAFHSVSEAELVLALHALELASNHQTASSPNRIEHGSIIPEELLPDLREAGVTVVGQPGLVRERGDIYQQELAPELHSWVHRAASLRRNGIPYAIGSDAPVLEPHPLAHLAAARSRSTRSGERPWPR